MQFAELLVPSNGRFTQEDLRCLWQAGSELASWRAARQAVARSEGTFGTPEIAGQAPELRDWRSLTACAQDAASLLAGWPTMLDRREAWYAIGIPVGVEDLASTERGAEQRGYVAADNQGQLVVTQSARTRGTRRPLTSHTLATLCLAIVQLVRKSLPPTEQRLLRPLLQPIAAVGQRATAPTGARDPDPSSWPPAFLAFSASCMRVLVEVQSAERGRGVIPFLDADELYEAWLATEVRRRLDARFGAWVAPGSDALAAWNHEGVRFELWVKPSISRAGLQLGTAQLQAIVAQTLTPDLVLTANRGDKTELTVLDAKSWAVMLPEDALAQSAKYLYGLRRPDAPAAIPAIVGVDLVTCAARPAVSDPALSRVNIISVTPTRATDLLDERINELVDQLIDALSERERSAST
ncbi:hypothetical protein ACI796_02220 [Geodermatophilus sp. SYSU D00525]